MYKIIHSIIAVILFIAVGTNLNIAHAATITVDANKFINPFKDEIRGVNMGGWWTYYYGRPYPNDSGKLRELTKLIKPGVLRHAGGLASNNIKWDRNNTDQYPALYGNQRRPYNPKKSGLDRCSSINPIDVPDAYRYSYQADEIDSLYEFANYVNADIMIEVNITTCDPDMWADMVSYANIENNYDIKYWELGNELDLIRTEGVADAPIGPEYVRRYKIYHDAMKAKDSTIEIVGPATASHEEGSWFRAFTDFIDPLTKDSDVQQKQMLDALSYHYYPMWNRSGGIMTLDDMFAFSEVDGKIQRSREFVTESTKAKRQMLNDRGLNDTQIAITEFNAMAATVDTNYNFNHANALYVADMLGRFAYAGADMVLMWELYDSPTGGAGYGMIDLNNSKYYISNDKTGETTLKDNFEIMPAYYTYFMYGQFFGDRMVKALSSQEENLSVWASTDSSDSGKLKLLIINLNGEKVATEINTQNFNPQSGVAYKMTSELFSSAQDKEAVLSGTNINGIEIDTSSVTRILESKEEILNSGESIDNLSSSFNYTFPEYSVTSIILRNTEKPSNESNDQISEIEQETEGVKPFSDSTGHSYESAIEYLKNEGIISGYPDGSFKPDRRVNRAEFVKILVGASTEQNLDLYANNCFVDVVKGSWFSKYVCYAKSKGIIGGYPDGTFQPAKSINLAEATKIIVNTMEIETVDKPGAEWYESYVLIMQNNKYIPKTFRSISQLVSRGEMSELIWRVKRKINSKDSATLITN